MFQIDTKQIPKSIWLFALLIIPTFIGLACVIVLPENAPYSTWWAHDRSILLDGAWRIYSGQIPYQDFHTALGPLTHQIIAFAMAAFDAINVSSIRYGSFCLSLLLMSAMWFIAYRRTSPWMSYVLTLFVGLLVVAPRFLGLKFGLQISYAMLYNRHAEAILMLVSLILLLPPRDESSNHWIETFVAGVGLGLLFFTKLNYFGIGLGAFSLYCLLHFIEPKTFQTSRRNFVTLTAAFFGTILFMLIASGVSLLDYLQDLQRGLGVQDYRYRLIVLLGNFVYILVPGLILIGIAGFQSRIASQRKTRASVLIALFFVFAACGIAYGSFQETEFPILAIGALILVERRKTNLLSARKTGLLALIPLIFCLPILAMDAAAVGRSLFPTEKIQKSLVELPTSSLEDWAITELNYARYLHSGVRFIRRHELPVHKIMLLDFMNPFAFALQEEPAKNTMLWYHKDRSFSDKPPLDADYLFKDIEYIMVPIRHNEGSTWELYALYEQYIDKHFKKDPKLNDGFWQIWTRR